MIIIKTNNKLKMVGKASEIMVQLNELAKSSLTVKEYLNILS